jgi:hypothetical protein
VRARLALAALVLACGTSAEEREAAAVLRAADALRDAPSEAAPQRRALLAALEGAPAADPRAARARDACTRAYRLLLDGNDLQARVQAALDPRGPRGAGAGGDPPAGLLGDLAAADAKIRESAAAMPECDRGLAELRRRARGPG